MKVNRVRRHLREDSIGPDNWLHKGKKKQNKNIRQKSQKFSDIIKSMDFNVIWDSTRGYKLCVE